MRPRRRAFFVTGTDTAVGKTRASCAMLDAAAARGLSTVGIKPLAAGAEPGPNGLRNDDALALQRHATLELSYPEVNPVCFEPPIAPHIAAARAGVSLSIERLSGLCRGVMMQGADFCLIEGAGGWKVPVNDRQFLGQLARELKIPVILVVGMRLGCLNHALLSAQAIAADGVPLAGWVSNRIEPEMECYEENLACLKRHLDAPLLAEIPWLEEGQEGKAADCFDLDPLFAA